MWPVVHVYIGLGVGELLGYTFGLYNPDYSVHFGHIQDFWTSSQKQSQSENKYLLGLHIQIVGPFRTHSGFFCMFCQHI